MRTFEKAHSIISSAPSDAMRDAVGLAAMALMIFAGFLVPALL